MEISDDQYERLVGLIAEARAAFVTELNSVNVTLEEAQRSSRSRFGELKAGIELTQSSLNVIEEDLSQVQTQVRDINRVQGEHGKILGEHGQSLEGLTELASTNFDLIESLNKHIHGESSSIRHDAEIRGSRPPQ